MKNIKLKKLELRYFKGEPKRDILFDDVTYIRGANESGKSTINDAWTFLIYGRDSLGKTNFDIKTQKTERVINKLGLGKENINPAAFFEDVEHSVYGEILVNDTLIKLRRAVIQEWSKTSDGGRKFKGHKTKCEFNVLDVSVTEYQNRISEIIDDNLFKLMTDINYFHSLKKEDRRNLLLTLDETVTNESLIKLYPQFEEVVKNLNGMEIAERRQVLNKQKTRLKKQLDEIPTRIDEVMLSMPEALDFEKIKKEISLLRSELKEIETKSDALDNSFKKQIEEADRLYKQKIAISGKRNDRMVQLEIEETERVEKLNEAFYSYSLNVDTLQSKIARYNILLDENNTDLTQQLSKLKDKREEMKILREAWKEENKKEYIVPVGDIICPTCKQVVVDDHSNPKQLFMKNKKKKLLEIKTEGTELTNWIGRTESDVDRLRSRAVAITKELDGYQKELDKLTSNPPVKHVRKEIDPNKDAEWVRLNNEWNSLEIPKPKIDDSDLVARRYKINKEIEALSKQLNIQDEIERNKIRLSSLNKEQREITSQLNIVDAQLDGLLEFSKTKTREVDSRINGKFKYVTFRLFEYTLGENLEKETCDTLIDGIDYESANNGARINAGIDVINAFAEHHKFFAPIFIDNAESVNKEKLLSSKSQQILLHVTDNEKLEIL